MSELVANCPRCDSTRVTFDVYANILAPTRNSQQKMYEAFCCCRNCGKSTTFFLDALDRAGHQILENNNGPAHVTGSINRFVNIRGSVSLKDRVSVSAPDFVPESQEAAFNEGATCMAVGCHNAAGAMFRLCIDLATKELLPDETQPEPNKATRRNLGLRLPWLFDNGLLPNSLRELSHCIKEDGNDGAHDGSLTEDDAADLLDFTSILLERLYTEPARIKEAEARRIRRREGNNSSA